MLEVDRTDEWMSQKQGIWVDVMVEMIFFETSFDWDRPDKKREKRVVEEGAV